MSTTIHLLSESFSLSNAKDAASKSQANNSGYAKITQEKSGKIENTKYKRRDARSRGQKRARGARRKRDAERDRKKPAREQFKF